MPDVHAILSASSAHRWLHCTPSARLEATIPDNSGKYAQEGTLAHSIAELKLAKYFQPMSKATFTRRMNKLKADPLYDPEMDRYTNEYAEYVKTRAAAYCMAPSVMLERRVDFSRFVPHGFGTSDCIIAIGKNLEVIDFKYGKGVKVSADENPQMMLYALGALDLISILMPIETVRMAIVQPRIDNISEYLVDAEVLTAWGKSIQPIAEMAYKGDGEQCAGEWCKFCRAKASCRTRADENMKLAKRDFVLPPLLSNDEVAQLLPQLDELVKWAADIQTFALDEVLAGRDIPGYKAVEGRSLRKFTDADAALKTLENEGYSPDMLYERRPLTLAAIEKLIGKKSFDELLSDFVDKPPGKPTLVPEADSRPPIRQMQISRDFN